MESVAHAGTIRRGRGRCPGVDSGSDGQYLRHVASRRTTKYSLAVAILVALPWLSGLVGTHDFLWDDIYVVRENPGLATPSVFHRAWSEPWSATSSSEDYRRRNGGYYRPLSTISLALDRQIWGLSPLGFRLTSIVIHGAAAGLIASILLGLGLSLHWAGGLAIFFGWHPVHSEVLASAAYRTTLLAGFFGLLAARFLVVRFREDEKADVLSLKAMAMAIMCFAAALLAKESALTLLAALPLLAAMGRPRSGRLAALVLGLAVVAGAWFMVRTSVILPPRAAVLGNLDFGDRLLLMLKTPVTYLGLFAWPAKLNPHWDVSLFYPPPVDWRTGVGVALLFVDGAILAWGWLRRRPWVLPWTACHAVASVYVGLVPLQMIVAERFMYLTMGLLVITVGVGLAGSEPRLPRRWARAAVLLALVGLLGFGVRSAVRMQAWTDYRTLLAERVADFPESFDARYSQALLCEGDGDLDCARRENRAALAIYPGFPLALDLQRRLDTAGGPGG